MSHPRSIMPGATYMITRRTILRHMLFRPDPAITQLILYALAVSAQRYRIQVHALCAMSTHLHIVLTDPDGILPSFLQFFHRLVALGTKVLRRWDGPVWDHGSTSVVRLMTPEAVVQEIAYTLANPVNAGLVRRAHEWPGAKALVSDLGRGVLHASQPDIYFDPTNPAWPSDIDLPLALPPTIAEDEADQYRRNVAAQLAQHEAEARTKVRPELILGPERAATVPPTSRATSFEPLRERNPTFAVGHRNGVEWRCAAASVRTFRAAYRAALEQWRSGVRGAVFPAGTWWMRVFHAVTVATGGAAL